MLVFVCLFFIRVVVPGVTVCDKSDSPSVNLYVLLNVVLGVQPYSTRVLAVQVCCKLFLMSGVQLCWFLHRKSSVLFA